MAFRVNFPLHRLKLSVLLLSTIRIYLGWNQQSCLMPVSAVWSPTHETQQTPSTAKWELESHNIVKDRRNILTDSFLALWAPSLSCWATTWHLLALPPQMCGFFVIVTKRWPWNHKFTWKESVGLVHVFPGFWTVSRRSVSVEYIFFTLPLEGYKAVSLLYKNYI